MSAYRELFQHIDIVMKMLEKRQHEPCREELSQRLSDTFNRQAFLRQYIPQLEAQATPTLKQDFAKAAKADGNIETPQLVKALTHCFFDPVIKAAMAINFAGESYLNEDEKPSPPEALEAAGKAEVFKAACRFRAILQDIVHNYQKLAPPAEGPYSESFKYYKSELLPVLSRIIKELPAELGFSAAQAQKMQARIKQDYDHGKEHLHKVSFG